MRYLLIKSLFLGALLAPALAPAAPGQLRPAGAGSGGDLLDSYLEVTRGALIETLHHIANDDDTEHLCECQSTDTGTDTSCRFLTLLSKARRDYCRAFILETYPQMLRLNEAETPTPFAISEKKLMVPDPDGVPRPVSAKTGLGPEGAITFHGESVERLWPMAVLMLMGHEFGHKVQRLHRPLFVDDNQPIGPYDFAGGGRRLLDAVGAAISLYAARYALVSRYTGIQDLFSCDITEHVSGNQVGGAQGGSARLFRSADLSHYETGIGRLPRDFQCYYREEKKGSRLFVKLRIEETRDCQEAAARQTTLELWRFHETQDSESDAPPELLKKIELPGRNPVCERSASPLRLDYQTDGRDFSFEVKYLGSARKINARR